MTTRPALVGRSPRHGQIGLARPAWAQQAQASPTASFQGRMKRGVFYYRRPGSPRGRILSITDKRSTLSRLIWSHPRYRMQAAVFLTRNAAHAARVLDAGERFPLAVPGNHSKGTMFLDGEHLRTDALERRIDEVARCFPGFYIGRFDIRYRDEAAFRAGRDLAVIELNGATAEPTDLYDPSHSLWSATGSSARSGRWCSRSAPPIDAWAHTRHRSGG